MKRIEKVSDIVSWRLCLGCGACAYTAPEGAIELLDVEGEGVRPKVLSLSKEEEAEILDICPGLGVDYSDFLEQPGNIKEVLDAFGPVLEIWEGHATDPDIRFKGSSGGAITAISHYCLEMEGMAGVLQVGEDREDPIRNSTRLSKTREDLIECTGSRYAPASTCDGLSLVEEADSPCVIVAQPSEVAALRNVEKIRPGLSAKVGLVLSFFCAGSPSTTGTLDLLRTLGEPSDAIKSLRYRGNGWPGMFATRRDDGLPAKEHKTYAESWARLQSFRPLATHLFPDGGGEGADISCGDPWYRKVTDGEPGSSLIVVRTEKGRRILRGAIEAGFINAALATPDQLKQSQLNLTSKRGAVWGRLFALRLLGIPAPNHRGMSLFANWLELPLSEKFKSIFGTIKRALQRRYRKAKVVSFNNAVSRAALNKREFK